MLKRKPFKKKVFTDVLAAFSLCVVDAPVAYGHFVGDMVDYTP